MTASADALQTVAERRARAFTDEERAALDVARELVRAGFPVFVAPAVAGVDGMWDSTGGSGGHGYRLPTGWQRTTADNAAVDAWRPGDGLALVTGHGLDALDVDPRDGGDGTAAALAAAGLWPTVLGSAATPSGGRHDLVAALGIGSSAGVVGPGVDVRAGLPDGTSRGFVWLAPTLRRSKLDGKVRAYAWTTPPMMGELDPADDSGAALAERVRERSPQRHTAPAADVAAPWEHPDVPEAEVEGLRERCVEVARERLARDLDVLDAVARLAVGEHPGGAGWEDAARVGAWTRLAELAASSWSGLAVHDVLAAIEGRGWPVAFVRHIAGKVEGAAARGARPTPSPVQHAAVVTEADALVGDVERWAPAVEPGEAPAVEVAALELSEAVIAERCAAERLAGRFAWAAGLGWLRWDGRRWAGVDPAVVVEAVRGWLKELAAPLLAEAAAAPHDPVAKAAGTAAGRLLQRRGVEAVASLARGLVAVAASDLDARPDLLSVRNGVVDLRTGELRPHDPALLLTKLAPADYVPGATSPDLTAALGALPPDTAEWTQVRLGQSATGYTPPDDLMLVAQGSGENGKTTLLSAVMSVLGDYAVLVSDRVLLASPDAHPTELMELRGARLAVIEETPEARRLNVARLKKIVGTPRIEARRIRQDSVTFEATHALLVTSNFRPSVEETDHGTWRRLALVPFPYSFVKKGQPLRAEHERHGDPGLRERVAASPEARSAVLAWLVEGARRWYAAGRVMPELPGSVVAATRAWRVESDAVLGYLDEQIVADPGRHVTVADLSADLNAWLQARGQQPWGAKTIAARFGDHGEVRRLGVEARLMRPGPGLSRRPLVVAADVPGRYRAWSGVRFRTPADDAADHLAVPPQQRVEREEQVAR